MKRLFSRVVNKVPKLGMGMLFLAACVGSTTTSGVSCEFDPAASCGICNNETVYYCECAGVDTLVYRQDEESPCAPSVWHCGLCPGGTLPTAKTHDCEDVETPVPTTGYTPFDCTPWDPGASISVSGSAYSVDSALVSMLESDVTPVYACDSARVNVNSGNLIIQSAVSTDMVYLLGLRNGDQFVEVNGMSLASPYDAAIAYTTLWLNMGTTTYSLKVLRGSSFVYKVYTLY